MRSTFMMYPPVNSLPAVSVGNNVAMSTRSLSRLMFSMNMYTPR